MVEPTWTVWGGTPPRARFASESHCWARALGRPKETVEHQAEENPLADELRRMDPEERRAWLRDLNRRSKEAAEH